MSQKYVIAYFIKPVEPKYNFSCKEWPLHVTLLPNFVVSDSLDELIDKVNEISHSMSPFSIQVGDDENFGPNGEVLVSLIIPKADILSLHSKLLAITKSYEFDTPQYIGKGYRPHATKQVINQLISGDSYLLDSMTLVDMFPNNDIERREIIKTFNLK
ncbi:MAG: 2'-5' RNA ligase family protein [Candidatus Saccharibacteria bacterium]